MTPCPTCGLAIYQRIGRKVQTQCEACRRACRLPRVCLTCGISIEDRPVQSARCAPCARERNKAQDRKQRRERYAAEQRRKFGKPALDDVWSAAAEAHCAPRDLALEARIDALAKHYRRTGRYTITDELVWARRVDLVAEQAQDLSDVAIISDQQRQWQAASRARRRQQKGQAA